MELIDQIMTLTNGLLPLITLVITAIIAPVLVPKLLRYQEARAEEAKLATQYRWTNIAVKRAEKKYPFHGQGAAKKAYVIAFLKSKGLYSNEIDIDMLLEDAVDDLNNKTEAQNE